MKPLETCTHVFSGFGDFYLDFIFKVITLKTSNDYFFLRCLSLILSF